MVDLADLWLPILLSAVFVFVVSSIIHMALPIHKGDWGKLPSEEKLLAEMRAQGLQPGCYMFPSAACMKDMGTPEMLAKFKQGPVGFVTVLPSGAPAIGKSLVQWFLFSLVIGVFCGYIAKLALEHGADFRPVFRVTTTVGVLGYGIAALQDSIWKGVRWSITLKFLFDGVVYGLVTGAAFGWFWPR